MSSELDDIRTFQFRINNVTGTSVIISKYSVCALIKPCCCHSHPRKCVENYLFDFAAASATVTASNTNTPAAAAANATDAASNITTTTRSK